VNRAADPLDDGAPAFLTIVDATIISAPSSTQNADKQRDPEMHQTARANNGSSA
jgi:hypothetical protein